MRKLRLAFLSLGSLAHSGAYLSFFRDRGHEVHWITYDPPLKDYGVPTYQIARGVLPLAGRTKWRYLLAGLAARRLLRQIAPDLIHGHYVTSAGVICLVSGFRPYVLTAHGSDVIYSMRSRIWRAVLRAAFARASLVNVVSSELTDLVRQLGVPSERILEATLGVDTELFAYRPARAADRQFRLLCTRTLGPVYEPQTIVQACAKLKKRGFPFKLTFAAAGPLQGHVQEEVRKHGLQDCIEFLGGFKNESLPELLNSHDVYLSATRWDGTSISLLEAMAAGVFPIVSRISSNQNWLRDEEMSLMFDCGDASGLAAAIQRAASDENLRTRALRKNREVVELRADRQKNMLRLEEAYYQIAGATAATPAAASCGR